MSALVRRARALALLLLAAALGVPIPLAAHQFAPALLELQELELGRVAVRWVHLGDVVTPGMPLIEIEGEGGLELKATVESAIAGTSPEGIKTALAAWGGAVDEVVLRAIVAKDTVDDHLTLLRAC